MSAMALSTEDHPLPLIMKKVLRENLSGELSVRGSEFRKQLYFSEGKLVYAQSNRFDEKILTILHLIGKVTEEQYDLICSLQTCADDRVSALLIQNNFVSMKDLLSARIYQFRRIALSVFILTEGTWEFDTNIPPPIKGDRFFIHLAGILVEGARKLKSTSFLSSRKLSHIPRTHPISEVYRSLFIDEELHFFEELKSCQELTCREIISKWNMRPNDFWHHLTAFYMLDLVDFQESLQETHLAQDIQALLSLYEKVSDPSADGMELFGLSPEAKAEELEDAFNRLSSRFSPERFGSASAPQIKKIAETVKRRLEDIYLVLSVRTPSSKAASEPQKKPQIDDTKIRAKDLFNRGLDLYERDEFMDAIMMFKQALKLDPDDGDTYYLLGLSQSESEYLWNEAEANLKKAVELQPWSADPVYELGVLFRKQKKIKLAERCFRRVREISLEHSGAERAIGDLSRSRKSKKDKLAFLKKKIF